MPQNQNAIICSLKRQHHLLWLLLGLGFSLWLVSQLGQGGLISVLLLLGLLATYHAAGQWAARLIARSISRCEQARLFGALISSSLKTSVLFSLLSILFHLVLLAIVDGTGALELLTHIQVPILLRAAILPLLACTGAACTASDSAWPESTEMVHYPKNSGLPTPTD